MKMTKEIENVIEISWIVQKLRDTNVIDDVMEMDLKGWICDIATKFEEEYKDTDWSEESYYDEIEKFAMKETATLLFDNFLYTTIIGTTIREHWNIFNSGTKVSDITEWFQNVFGSDTMQPLLMRW